MTTSILLKAVIAKLDRTIRNFWWGHSHNSRKTHFINWSTFQEDKENGGMGIRSLTHLNRVQIVKLIWKLLEDKNYVWGAIMKARYLKYKSFWEATSNSRSSSMWKAIIECREDVKEECIWNVGNGDIILITKDPWLNNHHNYRPELKDNIPLGNISKVSDLMLQNPTRWNTEIIHQLFQEHSATQMLSIFIPDSIEVAEDRLIWKPHPNGTFSCKSFIKYLKQKQPSSSSSDTFPWKTFWNIRDLASKILIFIWRVVHEGLDIFKNLGKICRRHQQRMQILQFCCRRS